MTARNYIYKVTATSENFGPIMLHRGIVFNDHGTDYVLHMTFDGPEVLPLNTFKSKRTILGYKRYRLTQDVSIDDIMYNQKDDKFEVLNNNCEHFALWCKTGIAMSSQVEEVLALFLPGIEKELAPSETAKEKHLPPKAADAVDACFYQNFCLSLKALAMSRLAALACRSARLS